MPATKKRKLRPNFRNFKGGETSWWKRNWWNNTVSIDENREECQENVKKDANLGDKDVEQLLRTVHHATFPNTPVSEVACGKGNDKMVWNDKFGFYYYDQDRKRMKHHTISQKYRNAMNKKYKELIKLGVLKK